MTVFDSGHLLNSNKDQWIYTPS